MPPDISHEQSLWNTGLQYVAGVDEVGRGCLAGPVVAAAVIFPKNISLPGVDDSKKLSPRMREQLAPSIESAALAWGIGVVSSSEIDAINILQASRKAMSIAVCALTPSPQHLLIDGRDRIDVPLPQTPIIGGDAISLSIAAASIIAKVYRDRLMTAYQSEFPHFNFSLHKGYGTARHLDELRTHGPTVLHRRSFAPVGRQSSVVSRQEKPQRRRQLQLPTTDD